LNPQRTKKEIRIQMGRITGRLVNLHHVPRGPLRLSAPNGEHLKASEDK